MDARPTAARLVDINRTGAWPFLTWAFRQRRVEADLDLLAARANGGHITAWASCHSDDTARASAVASELGWGPVWAHQMYVNALALVCDNPAHPRRTRRRCPRPLRRRAGHRAQHHGSHRRVLVGRMGGLGQVCFHADVPLPTPPGTTTRPPSPFGRCRLLVQRPGERFGEARSHGFGPPSAGVQHNAPVT